MPGPGQIHMHSSGPFQFNALLYNFEIDSSEVKPEHIDWISTIIPPLYKRTGIQIVMAGLASRTGSDSYNMALSRRRVEAVGNKIFLANAKRDNVSLNIEMTTYFGESAAAYAGVQDGVEDDLWRAVNISVSESKLYAYLPPPVRFKERRSSVTIFIKEEAKGITGGEPGEKGYQLAQAFRRANGAATNEVSEKTIMVDETFDIKKITYETTKKSIGKPYLFQSSVEFLTVTYSWGPMNLKSKTVTLVHKHAAQEYGQFQSEASSIDLGMAEYWFKHPLQAYENR
jgi:hypothetical protein